MRHLLVVCLGLCGVLVSCGGATGGGNPPPPPPASNSFAYVSNTNSATLTAYKINTSTGALTPTGGSPFGGVSNPMGLAISPNSELLAVGSIEGPGVSTFRVDKTTGSITPVTGSPFLTSGGGYPIRSVFHKSGKFLYSAMIPSAASNVWAFSLDAAGALSPVPGSPFAGQTLVGLGGTNSIALHPSGTYLYSSGPFMGITGYSIDATTGALTQLSGSPFVPTGAFFNSELAVHPSGTFLYMADLDADGVRVFPIASDGSVGAEIAGSPFATGAAPRDLALDPSGKFVFVPNEGDLTVAAFAVNGSTGALTLVGNADTGNGPSAVAVDSSGKFLYVTNYWDGKVSAYSIDSASGALALVAGSLFAAQDGAISVVTTK